MIPARDFRCDGHLRDRRNLVNVANPRPKKQHCSPAAGNGGSGDWRESVLEIGFMIDGVEYLIMKESDIMGVLDEPVAKKKAA
jgi:hypothetical protein